MSEKDDNKASTARALGVAKGVVVGAAGLAAAAAGAPAALGVSVGAFLGWAHDFTRDTLRGRRQKRLDDFFKQILTGDAKMGDDEYKEAVEKEPLSAEVITRLLEDEEDEKAWAYAGLFRAFAKDHVPKQHRIRFLRCARELTNAELLGMRSWHRSSKPHIAGPHVTFKITFGAQYREWFIQPELMQEENPHVIEVLCRWGFISRVHDRAKQAKTKIPGVPDIPSMTTEEYPVPGRFRLQVEPILALLLFVFANLAHGNGLDLARAETLSVHEEGRVDAVDYRRDRSAPLDGAIAGPGTRSTTHHTPEPAVDEGRLTLERQMRVLSDRLERLPTDSQEAAKVLKNIGNELNSIRTTGLSQADFAEAQKLAGPGGGTVTVRGRQVNVAPTVTFRVPRAGTPPGSAPPKKPPR